MQREEFMRLAIEKARQGLAQGQWPYGACIVNQGGVVSCVHNVAQGHMDPTAHAEVHAIRESCAKLKTLDLSGCEIYCTCEPCPMCFSACHIARISTIVYAVSLNEAEALRRTGQPLDASQIGTSGTAMSQRMKELLKSPIEVIGGFLRDEAVQLFYL